MDWNKCVFCRSDSKYLLDPSKTLNLRVCGYTLLVNNIERFIEEGIVLPKKIVVDMNYLRSEGSFALTLKQNCAKWHKNYTLEVTSSRVMMALRNLTKNKTEKKLPTKMRRTSRLVQQSISNAICFFSRFVILWVTKTYKETLTTSH